MVEEFVKDYIPMKEKFEELVKVLNNIKKGEKILIIGDNDGDGIPASAIFAKILKKLGLEYNKDFFTLFPEHDFRGKIKEDKEKQKELAQYNYIFLIDMSMDDYSFLTNTYICVLDHHKVETKVNLLINPMYDDEMKTKPNCCSAALTYCLYRLMFDDNLILQKIAFAASMYDWFPIGSLQYLNISKDDTEYFVNGGYINPTNYELVFITYQLYDKEFGTQFVFDKLYTVEKDLRSIVILPQAFWDKLNAFNKKANKVLIKIFENIETINNLNFVVLKESSRPYKNALNIRLRAVYPGCGSFIFFENKKEKGYNVSCRSQKYDLVKLIEFLKTECKTIFGGGHSVAAGFFVKKKEFAKCKKLIIDNIEKFKK